MKHRAKIISTSLIIVVAFVLALTFPLKDDELVTLSANDLCLGISQVSTSIAKLRSVGIPKQHVLDILYSEGPNDTLTQLFVSITDTAYEANITTEGQAARFGVAIYQMCMSDDDWVKSKRIEA